MAISIDGTGTIAGITAGGLPDDSITAAELSTKTFVSYAVICDQKAYNVEGGTFTAGWRTRDLNTEIVDADGIVSIGSNQFTLGAGNYLIKWSAPALSVGRSVSILQNITETTTDIIGTVEYSGPSDVVTTRSTGSGRVSLTGTTVYEIQHNGEATVANNGFGVNTSQSGYNSIYTIVEIYKEA